MRAEEISKYRSKKMKKHWMTLIIIFAFAVMALAQNPLPIKFSYQYVKKSDSDNIKLIVQNISKKTFYYSIAIQGRNDTGWVSLLSDINSLGQNEFLSLKPLTPGSKIVKYTSMKRIWYIYEYYKISKIRFGAMYYEKKNFDSKGGIIYIDP